MKKTCLWSKFEFPLTNLCSHSHTTSWSLWWDRNFGLYTCVLWVVFAKLHVLNCGSVNPCVGNLCKVWPSFDVSHNSSHGVFVLTHDVLVMLWNDCGPMLPLWSLDVDVDEPIARSIQVGVEREQRSLIGDVGVLGLKVVYKFDPRQQT